MAKLLRRRFPFLPPDGQVDHLVVGAGVVVSRLRLHPRPRPRAYTERASDLCTQGLAIAERLVKAFPDRTTFVVER